MAKKASAKKPTKSKAANGRALVTFLLDRTGSMSCIRDVTISSFNEYLKGLQDEKKAKIDFTLLQFDSQSIDKNYVSVPVGDVKPLTTETYQPRASTPLIDAAMKTILAVEQALTKRNDKPRVVVCIQTDGEENASRHYKWEDLNGKIKTKQAEGWEFNFMGAGIDAYQQAAKMGIAVASTVSYDSGDAVATASSFRATARNTSMFASGARGSTSYSMAQKRMSGDKFIGGHHTHKHTHVVVPPAPHAAPAADPLDLSSTDDLDLTR